MNALRPTLMLGLLLVLSGPAATQPTTPPQAGPMMMGQGMMGHGMMIGNMARHHQYMMGGVSARYRAARNPLPYDEQTMRRGAAVYAEGCAACHGDSGNGDGPAAKGLNPPPANLRWGSGMHMMRGDSFLYWTIEEGGAPVGSAMPAFKFALPEKDVWAVITYVQHGLGTANHHHCCR